MFCGRILAVRGEITQTHELEGFSCLGVCQTGFHLTAGENFQRVGIQTGQEILAGGIGIGIVKEVRILTNLGIDCGLGIYPVDGSALDLTAVSRITATGFGVVGGKYFGDIAILVGVVTGTLNEVSALQAALGTIRVKTLILGNGLCQKIVCFNPEVAGEADFPGAVFGTVGIVLDGDSFGLAIGVVGNGQLMGFTTAITRAAVSFRSSRRQNSRKA